MFHCLPKRIRHLTTIFHASCCCFRFASKQSLQITHLHSVRRTEFVHRNRKLTTPFWPLRSEGMPKVLSNNILSDFIGTTTDGKTSGVVGSCTLGADTCCGLACFPKPKRATLGTNSFESNSKVFLLSLLIDGTVGSETPGATKLFVASSDIGHIKSCIRELKFRLSQITHELIPQARTRRNPLTPKLLPLQNAWSKTSIFSNSVTIPFVVSSQCSQSPPSAPQVQVPTLFACVAVPVPCFTSLFDIASFSMNSPPKSVRLLQEREDGTDL